MSADTAVISPCASEVEKERSTRRIILSTPIMGTLWFAGWLFTIGFAELGFWRGLIGLIIWPYFLGGLAH